MINARLRGRAALAGAIALVCAGAAACDSVLDIEDPKNRPDDGAAGETSSAGKASSTAGTASAIPEGGAAGEGGSSSSGSGPVTMAGNGGEGGEPTPRDCETDSVRCTDKAPEVCDETGHWVPNTEEAEGDCAVACNAGKCVECAKDEKRCAVCAEDDKNCTQRMPQTCANGVWIDAKEPCEHFCSGGLCGQPPSCGGDSELDSVCVGGESCCRSLYVPGGTYSRSYDGTEYFPDASFTAQISPFLLDKFEVTVGRMKQFVAAYPFTPAKGQGKSPHIAADLGWNDAPLPEDPEALVASLASCDSSTWSTSLESDDRLPINCVPSNLAYAFCIWDGGRLPTEAEWNFAAAGGSEQRVYPWKPPIEGGPISDKLAYYYAENHTLPIPVGSLQLGNGRWGHADLAGNVSEWTLDFYQDYSSDLCRDCLITGSSGLRVRRGGSYLMLGEVVIVSLRDPADFDTKSTETGIRCARDIE